LVLAELNPTTAVALATGRKAVAARARSVVRLGMVSEEDGVWTKYVKECSRRKTVKEWMVTITTITTIKTTIKTARRRGRGGRGRNLLPGTERS
jgi:hypothetical protein